MSQLVPLGFGRLFHFPVANPGAGLPVDIIAAAGYYYLVEGIICRLVTDATVINRQVWLEYQNGTYSVGRIWSTNMHAASATVYYTWSRFSNFNSQNASNFNHNGLRDGVLIDGIYGLRISADSLQAGDVFDQIAIRGRRWMSA